MLARRRLSPLLWVAFAAALAGAPQTAQGAGDGARAWGADYDGQLGDGATSDVSTPHAVSGLSHATAIAAGASHSIALLAGGTVEAWGLNASGELGTGSNSGPDLCNTSTACSTTPVAVSGLSKVVAIEAGDNYSLALLADGTVKAWGSNNYGQLGDGTTTDRPAPVTVKGLSRVVAIAAGGFHALALRADGTVEAWGQNTSGELGNGNDTGPDSCNGSPCAKEPLPVPGVRRVVAISAGLVDSQSLALHPNGTLTAWGSNHDGELGNGNDTGPETCGSFACSTKPIAIKTVTGISSISAGAGYTFARLTNGTAKSWGYNYSGGLGNGTDTPRTQPTPGHVSGLSGIRDVAAGDGQGLALMSGGDLRAWGYNGNGQLGNGSSNSGPETCNSTAPCSKVPVAVTGISRGTAIAAGFSHDLALVGASRRLRVARAGAGSGAVGGQGILCPPVCSRRYPDAATATLLADAAPGAGFAGWSGACRGRGSCRVRMGADRTVTATFGPPKGTRITAARIRPQKHSATFRFTAPGAITGFQCALVKRRPGHPTSTPKFSKCSSPKRYRSLGAGHYVFRVRAVDVLGADRTPARRRFGI